MKLHYDELLSSFAFNLSLRPYKLVSVLRDVGGVGGGGGADYVLLTEDDATMCGGHLAGGV